MPDSVTELQLPPAPKILIVRLSALGDVIFAMPAVTSLRRRYPDAHITWLVESGSADIVRHHPHVDRVVALPRRHLRKAFRRPWRLPGAIADVLGRMRECRKEGLDLVIDFQGNTKSGIFTGLSRGRVRVGHDRLSRKELLNGLFTNVKVHPVPEGAATRHRTERDLGLLRAVGVPAVYESCPLTLPEEVQTSARSFLSDLPGSGPVVVLHPGTSAFGAFKRWAPERFSELADRLIDERSARVTISWGPDEESLASAVVSGMARSGVLFPPPSNLLFPAALYGRADLVVGSDSGPLHLAALMGAPTLTLFGPKDPDVYRPTGEKGRVVWMRVDCSPCTLRTCSHVTCMRSMTVDDVARHALEMLQPRPSSPDD